MTVTIKEGSLGAILYNSRIIGDADIAAALEEQQRRGIRFGEALIALGLVSQEDIDWALSNQLDIPYIHLRREQIDESALQALPARLCRQHSLIPLIRSDDELSIAIADPLNTEAVRAAGELSGCRINISIALSHEIQAMIALCYGTDDGLLGFSSTTLTPEQVAAINADPSGSRLFTHLLEFSILQHLTACTFQPLGERVAIVARSGSGLQELGSLPPAHYPAVAARFREAAAIDAASTEPSQCGTLTVSLHDRHYTFQVLLLQSANGDYLTVRQHVAAVIPASLTELRIPAEQKQQFADLALLRPGLILFAARSLQERCRFMDLLLEECATTNASVLLLGTEPGRMRKRFPRIPLPAGDTSRGRLIMEALEHGPDILVIEDATALEPFSAAARAALRGKLVLAGIEIRGTEHLMNHLIGFRRHNAFSSPFLRGIVSFIGMQLLCPECRSAQPATSDEQHNLGLSPPPTELFRATGCEQCGFTGISERHLLTDIISFDTHLHQLLDSAANGADFMASLRLRDYHGSTAAGEALLRGGAVSPEEYLAARF